MRRFLKCIIFVQITKIYSDISKDVQFLLSSGNTTNSGSTEYFFKHPQKRNSTPILKLLICRNVYMHVYIIYFLQQNHVIKNSDILQNGMDFGKKIYRFTLINYFKWHDGGPSVKLLQIKYMYTCNYMMYHI